MHVWQDHVRCPHDDNICEFEYKSTSAPTSYFTSKTQTRWQTGAQYRFLSLKVWHCWQEPQLEHHHRPHNCCRSIWRRMVLCTKRRDTDVRSPILVLTITRYLPSEPFSKLQCNSTTIIYMRQTWSDVEASEEAIRAFQKEEFRKRAGANVVLSAEFGEARWYFHLLVVTLCGVCPIHFEQMKFLIKLIICDRVAITFLAQWHPLIAPRRGDLRPEFAHEGWHAQILDRYVRQNEIHFRR